MAACHAARGRFDSAEKIRELYVEKGRLDDVFRQITSHEGARRNA